MDFPAFLTALRDHAAGPLSILTRGVEVGWDSALLADGAVLVDLPGLVSSRAGGEGLNLQIARRLVHVDVPWNPMEMEQRIGRVHRFKSRRTILVDTLVTRDSREAEVYEVARTKLEIISRSLVSPDRSDAVFARVMALVPPDELLQVMGRGSLSPLTAEDRSDIERLVSAGYDRWFSFDDNYRSHQQRIRALEPGHATWCDVNRMARAWLRSATPPRASSGPSPGRSGWALWSRPKRWMSSITASSRPTGPSATPWWRVGSSASPGC